MDFEKLAATAVVRRNSLDFVEQIFLLNQARRPVVMVNDAAQAGDLPGIQIDRCITPAEKTGWFSQRHPLINDDLPAQVSYTSGTEGLPKGILLTHANMADAAQRIIDEMQMTDEVREYVGVPATYSFGLARYRAISAIGGQAYLSPRGFDPMELARMLRAGEVNSLSAVPTLLRILLDAPGVIGDAGRKLRWMEIGSQHMTGDEKRRIRQMFPNARIVQHYGLTEASRSTFLRVSEASGEALDSVGGPVGHTEIDLSADNRIRIRGPHVAKSRIDAEGLHDLQDADGWLQTNDLGHMQDGHLFFDGRADDLINVGGIKIAPDQLEERLRTGLRPGTRIAVAKVPDAQRGDGVLVAIEGDEPATARVEDLARAALAEMGVVAGGALHVMAVDSLPVTDTGKVQRRVLSKDFQSRQAAMPLDTDTNSVEIDDVLSLFRHEFPGRPVQPEATFESLGGDSLHYIQFSLAFEQRFGALPDEWEKLSVTELQRSIGQVQTSRWRRLEPSTALRAFFIICIVALHTDAFVYSRNYSAAYFLIILAGYSVARFQLPEIIRTDSVKTLWGTIKYVAVPTILMTAFLQVATHRFEILPLLLISNYLDPSQLKGFLFYFVEFYIQILVLAALLFSVPRVREAFKERPFASAVVLLVVVAILDQAIEYVWDGEYNYHRTPWNYGWAFALGMVMAFAKDWKTKLIALGLVIVAEELKWGNTPASFYVTMGSLVLLFAPAFKVPGWLKVPVAEIAAASLFIFLTHEVVMSTTLKIFGYGTPWLTMVLALIVGVIAAHVYAWGARKFIQLTGRGQATREVEGSV